MSLSIRGLDDICRLCAIESETGVSIYEQEGENLSLEQKIINCLRIEVSRDDLLPKKVCSTCNALLEELHQFSCRAANAQQTLNFLFDLQLRQLQEQELSLLHNVKLEGNLIKNELDDLVNQQADLRTDNHIVDSSQLNFAQLDVLCADVRQECSSALANFQHSDLNKQKIDELFHSDEVNGLPTTENVGTMVEEPRLGHRRKMFLPKKTLERREKMVEEVDLASNDALQLSTSHEEIISTESTADIHCLSVNEDVVQANVPETSTPQANLDSEFKPVDFDQSDRFEDMFNEEDASSDDNAPTITSFSTSRDWKIACVKCRDVFPRRTDFEKHYKDSHDAKPIYTCSECGKSISKFSTFRSHCFRHESKFSCLYCDKVFTLESMLRVHVLSRHISMRPFICETCGRGYVTQYRLEIHQKKHEMGNSEFRCDQCDKVLQTRNGLSTHMITHRYGRRFMCDVCGKTFTQKVNMQQHVKWHKGEKPFKCETCPKTFSERSHLTRHKAKHTTDRPFECTVCLKKYKTERCLKVHSQVHQVTRPFVCSECGKGFLNGYKLKEHYHCHTGERPYACKYCERTFTNFSNWLKHTRRRHNVDHKTGVKLKEEETPPAPNNRPQLPPPDLLDNMELFDMAEVKVKQDHLLTDSAQSILPLFHVSSDLSQFQLPDQQLFDYSDQSQPLPLLENVGKVFHG